MNLKKLILSCVAVSMIGGITMAPVTASAQTAYQHRQKTKNDWRNLAYAGAGLGLLGILTHKDTVTAIGAGTAGYGLYRYEHDRKSQRAIRDAYNRRVMYSHYGMRRHHKLHRHVRHGHVYYW